MKTYRDDITVFLCLRLCLFLGWVAFGWQARDLPAKDLNTKRTWRGIKAGWDNTTEVNDPMLLQQSESHR